MKLLRNSTEIKDAVEDLSGSSKNFRWAVAWATESVLGLVPLEDYWDKIAQLTVGTSFIHTHPDFISKFNEHPNVGFVLKSKGVFHPRGVFHPKIYYFEHGDGRWDCVVGSANFTGSAFSRNAEVALHINQDDESAEATRESIITTMNDYKNLGETLTKAQIKKYRKDWERMQKNSRKLPGANPLLHIPMINEDFDKFFKMVKKGGGKESMIERLDVLDAAAKLFSNHSRFSEIDEGGRRRLAGFVSYPEREEGEPEWWYFGNMRGAGKFKKAINQNNQGISNALDHIPPDGPVGRENFDAYVDLFLRSFEKSGVATATRLLAMKRPDYFVCINKANKRGLREEFAVPKNIDLDNYWSGLIEPIQESNWWNSPEPSGDTEWRVWRGRVAMLDAHFYSREDQIGKR